MRNKIVGIVRDRGDDYTFMSKDAIEVELYEETHDTSNKKTIKKSLSGSGYSYRKILLKSSSKIKLKKWNETYYQSILNEPKKRLKVKGTKEKLENKSHNHSQKNRIDLCNSLSSDNTLIKNVKLLEEIWDNTHIYIQRYLLFVGGGVRNSNALIVCIMSTKNNPFYTNEMFRLVKRNGYVEFQHKSSNPNYSRCTKFTYLKNVEVLSIKQADEESIVNYLL